MAGSNARTVRPASARREESMKSRAMFGFAGLAILSACTDTGMATVQLGNSILCGPTEVILSSQQVTSMDAAAGERAYARDICAAVAGIDTTGMTEPTQVRLILPSGIETTVRVRQNMR
jgi:hypothetical protein